MDRLYSFLAFSDHRAARIVRRTRRAVLDFSVPAPSLIIRPALAVVLAIRSAYYFVMRVFICEPLFKAYCTRYGRNLRTGVFVHWVQGRGRMILGDDVIIDGKCAFTFASRFTGAPTLIVGDGTGIGHGCVFTIGREIRIGRNVRIALNVMMFDSPGHPANPAARLAGLPAGNEDVRPIIIGDNAWIGSGAIIFPGVTIGEGAVVSAGAAVMSDVPPFTIVAGNPARQIRSFAERPRDTTPREAAAAARPTPAA